MFLISIFLLSIIRFVQPLEQSDSLWNEFQQFQQKFHKSYSSLKDLEYRFEVFSNNVRSIFEHNQDGNQTFTMGINTFSDLTPSEFQQMYTGGWSIPTLGLGKCGSYNTVSTNLPTSIDWRTQNAVTPVKDQGQCGSCWSFSSSGAMEGAWAISKHTLVSLSEQQLVDCSKKYGNLGCKGGEMDSAFLYAIDNGLCSESAYPYVSGQTLAAGTCQTCTPVATFSDCMDVSPDDQLVLQSAVANKGPVSIAIEADTRIFQSYSSGVITSTSCGTNLDHGVLIVGYGTEKEQPYWLVKNSWGTSWGENGYVKIARTNSRNDPGICGVAMQPSFPVV
jgi:C1A family cysteine protease